MLSHRFVCHVLLDHRPLTSAQEVQNESLSQHHLTGPQHASPATVGGQGGAGQGRKLLSVGEPQPGSKVLAERLHVPHDTVFIGSLTAGFQGPVVIVIVI